MTFFYETFKKGYFLFEKGNTRIVIATFLHSSVDLDMNIKMFANYSLYLFYISVIINNILYFCYKKNFEKNFAIKAHSDTFDSKITIL